LGFIRLAASRLRRLVGHDASTYGFIVIPNRTSARRASCWLSWLKGSVREEVAHQLIKDNLRLAPETLLEAATLQRIDRMHAIANCKPLLSLGQGAPLGVILLPEFLRSNGIGLSNASCTDEALPSRRKANRYLGESAPIAREQLRRCEGLH
jgi:hypothetical protein